MRKLAFKENDAGAALQVERAKVMRAAETIIHAQSAVGNGKKVTLNHPYTKVAGGT